MKFKRFSPYLFIIILIITIINPIPIFSTQTPKSFVLDITPQVTREWTFMLYFCGDSRDHEVTESLDNSANFVGNYQETVISKLRDEHLLEGSEADLNVLALFDRPYTPSQPNGYAQLLKIERNNLTILADYGAVNMGAAGTLSGFITYCKTYFPADNYALTLSDHGRGYAGLCFDYHAPHPYFEYALGDCLSVQEVASALNLAGGVDTLFIDTCLGGSFELQWQLAGEAHYVVAGETTQSGKGIYHPRDILYNLSRNTAMTPYELALEGFRSCKNPVFFPPNPNDPIKYVWDSASVYNLDQFDYTELAEEPSLMDAFDMFSFYLFDELTYNATNMREVLADIKWELAQIIPALVSNESLMVDLGDFVAKIVDHAAEFHNEVDLVNYGNHVLARLQPCYSDNNNTLIDYHNRPSYVDEGYTGFSICLPYNNLLYNGFLYPNLYNTFDISQETYWDEFIFSLYPPNDVLFEKPKLEYYEFYLDKIDPTVHMHIYIDDPLELPLHIGYTRTSNANVGMDVEIGLDGASFLDTMIYGTCLVKIPVANLPAAFKDATKREIQVIINASNAASTALDVNLTVRHIDPTGVLWEDTKTFDIQIGQVISTIVTTDDEWSDWEELSPPTTDTVDGFTLPITIFSVILSFSALLIIYRRKKFKWNLFLF
ncbi:MAG: hypothetical protein FK734_06825 [Asgard group archaeon]|nr:hypothetical protein [Asgard group archaeon]